MFFSAFFFLSVRKSFLVVFIETYKYFLFIYGCKSMLICVSKSLKNDFKTFCFDKKKRTLIFYLIVFNRSFLVFHK